MKNFCLCLWIQFGKFNVLYCNNFNQVIYHTLIKHSISWQEILTILKRYMRILLSTLMCSILHPARSPEIHIIQSNPNNYSTTVLHLSQTCYLEDISIKYFENYVLHWTRNKLIFCCGRAHLWQISVCSLCEYFHLLLIKVYLIL